MIYRGGKENMIAAATPMQLRQICSRSSNRESWAARRKNGPASAAATKFYFELRHPHPRPPLLHTRTLKRGCQPWHVTVEKMKDY